VKRRLYILLILILLILMPGLARAQKVCAVLSSGIKPYVEAMDGFKKAFKGPVEEMVLGDNPAFAGEVADKVRNSPCPVVVALGSNALKFLKLRVTEKPIVFAMTLSPAVEGLSGRDITGVFLEPSARAALAAIKKVVPAASRIGALYSRTSRGDYLDEARRAAAGLGLEIVAEQAATVGEVVRQAASIMTRCDVLLMIPDSVTSSQGAFEAIFAASLKGNVPVFAISQKYVSEGALAALATDYKDNGVQAAEIAQRIVSGAAASSIPYEPARKAGIVLNLKAAKRMGITISPQVIAEAVEVYR